MSEELKQFRASVALVRTAPMLNKGPAADVALSCLKKWCEMIEARLEKLEGEKRG